MLTQLPPWQRPGSSWHSSISEEGENSGGVTACQPSPGSMFTPGSALGSSHHFQLSLEPGARPRRAHTCCLSFCGQGAQQAPSQTSAMADSVHMGLGSTSTQGHLTFQDDGDGVGPETFSSRAQGLVLGCGKSQSGESLAEWAPRKQEG